MENGDATTDADLAIVDTLALTMVDGGLGIREGATIAVRDGEIVYVGPAEGFEGDPERTIDGSELVTTPGFVNVHAHTGLTLLRGGAQDVPEIQWMNRALGPLSDRLTPEDRVVGAKLGALEAIRSGTTTIGEYAGGVERLVGEALEPAGMRVVASETINAVAGSSADLGPDEAYPLDPAKGDAALQRNEDLFEAYADHGRISALYGPQALDMVPADLLREIRDRAETHDRGIHMHVAQGDRERRQIEARYGAGATTVGVLEDLGLASDRLLAAHLHGASREERSRLAEGGVRMAANPSSIAAIDGVTPPLADYREAGGVAGVGTDQAPGPGGHEFLRELRTAALLSKADRGDPTALPAWEALRVGTIEGARALGIADRVGSLEVGKRADIALFDLAHPSTAPIVSEPLHTAVPNLIYGATGGLVECVVVEGEVVFEDGEVRTMDEEEVIAEAGERAERLFGEAGEDWRAAGSELADRADEGRL